jgi:two-component system, NtrC family, response regulator HydG
LNLNCLVIDDEESVQRTLSAFLKREGVKVSAASDYRQAEEKLKKNSFDLVFLDVFLGENSGIDLLRDIRGYNQDTMIVMITGQPDLDMVTESLRLGAFDFMTKPFSYQQIVSILQRALRNRTILLEKEQKQANLDAIFSSASDAIILVDKQCRLLQSNEAALRLCGYTPDHLALPLCNIDSGCSGKCRKVLSTVVSKGSLVQASRFDCACSDGTKRYFSLSASPVFDHNGTINGAVAIMRDETHLVFLEKQLQQQNGYAGIVGKSSPMQKIYNLIENLTDVQTTVLLNGESGTGKELVAAALHYQGARKAKPFVKVNCSALSENLLESELFGHVRGAFTGAVSNKIGRFKMADGGTIFLDEIGDISMSMQVKLLRVLQEQEFEPVGDSSPIKVNVRIIAATHQDLAEKVRQGTFRHDLFYRLNVVRLVIPPLRERIDDIPVLVEYFIKKFNHKFERSITGVSGDVMEFFLMHPWPGNVRELEHTIEHAAIMCKQSVITTAYLPEDLIVLSRASVQALIDDVALPAEKGLTIEQALEKAGGNKAKAARLLGVSRRTLYNRLGL